MESVDPLDQILARNRAANKASATQAEKFKFYSSAGDSGTQEEYLELQFRNGVLVCFAYRDLSWFSYDPDGAIDLEFGGYSVVIRGNGLSKLFRGLKKRLVEWVREADTEMQNNPANETYIEALFIRPPGDAEEEEEGEEKQGQGQ